jgi:ABC-type oligopeptide transport system ATPase subunit
LTVRALRKYFPVRGGILQTVQAQVQAVDGVSFDVQRGEILGIVGESGCGKSTLARLIQRLIEPDAGEIRFAGHNTLSTSAAAFKAFCRQVQMVFQDPYSSLNPPGTSRTPSPSMRACTGLAPHGTQQSVGSVAQS